MEYFMKVSNYSLLFFLGVFSLHIVCDNEYYSQKGQDKYLHEKFFKEKTDGVFVDIGAYDGITISNSYFFEKTLGWQGFCIEPNPEAFEKLKNNRNCICIQGCITNFNGTADFLWVHGAKNENGYGWSHTGVSGLSANCEPGHLEYPCVDGHLLSGLVDKYDPAHLGRIDSTVERENAIKEIIKVDCFLLEDILTKYNFFHIDYLSIDTEGGEMDILKSIDLEKIDIEIIDVETNYSKDRVAAREYLTPRGYEFITRIGQDDIYKKIRN